MAEVHGQTWTAPSGASAPGTHLSLSAPGWPAPMYDERFVFSLDNVAVNASRIPEPATVLLRGAALIAGRFWRRRA